MKVDLIPDPSLYPFQPRWFDSYAGRLHYLDEGAARRSCSATSTPRTTGAPACAAPR